MTLTKLETERDELRAEVARLRAACEKEFASVEQLSAEVARLKADKARLEFVFEQCKPCHSAPTGRYYQALSRYDLDAAIKDAETVHPYGFAPDVSADHDLERRLTLCHFVLTAIVSRKPIMGSKGEYLNGQLDALNACADAAKQALAETEPKP